MKFAILATLVLVWASEWVQVRSVWCANSQQPFTSEKAEEVEGHKYQLDPLPSSDSVDTNEVAFLAYEIIGHSILAYEIADRTSHQLRGPPTIEC